MATREGKSPLTERERRVWRNGLNKGAAMAEQRILEALEQAGLEVSRFVERLRLRGVVAEPPEDFSDEHPAEQLRRPR